MMIVYRISAVSLAAFVLFSASILSAFAQTNKTLVLNQSVEHDINGGGTQVYTFPAEANKNIRITILQKGIDVFTTAFDAEKKKIAEVDSQNARNGPERLEFVTEKDGEYTIEVSAGKDQPAGKIAVTLEEMRAAVENDRIKMRAAKIFWAADALRLKRTAESRSQAITQFAEALSLYEKINDSYGRAYTYFSLSLTFDALGDYKKALEFLKLALPLWREVRDRPSEAVTLNRLGVSYLYAGDLPTAIEHSNQSLAIYNEIGDRRGEASVYNNLAVIYSRQGETAKGMELYEKAYKIQLAEGRKSAAAVALNNIAVANVNLGNFDNALKIHAQALDLWRELGFKDDEGLTLIEIGIINQMRGEARRSLALYQQALPLCVESGNKNCEARAYANLATSHRLLGETQNALDAAAKSAEIYKTRGQRDGHGRILRETGLLYFTVGDYQRAGDFLNESLEIFVKSGNKFEESAAASNLGELFKRQGNIEKAIEYFTRALNLTRALKDLNGQAASLIDLGTLESSRGNSENAVKFYGEALDISSKTGSKRSEARSLLYFGIERQKQGNFPQALEYLKRALDIYRAAELKSDEPFTLYQMALTRKNAGMLDEAVVDIETAIGIIETLRGNIAATSQRASYFASAQNYYELYVAILMLKHKAQPDKQFDFKAFQASEAARARSLLDLLNESNTDLKANIDPKLAAREKEIIEQINAKAASQIQVFSDPKKKELAKALTREIDELSREYEMLQAKIKQADPRYTAITKRSPMTLTETQKLLGETDILAEFKLGKTQSFLWLITREKIESFELPPRETIEESAIQLYVNLTARNRKVENETAEQRSQRIKRSDADFQALASRLTKLLFGSASSQISNKNVAVIADGALQYIPFNTLLESNRIAALPSLSVLAEIRGRAAKTKLEKTINVFADPIFEVSDSRLETASAKANPLSSSPDLKNALRDFQLGENFPRLLGTRTEARNITALLPKNEADVEIDFDASRANVTGKDLSKYRILHFATHGLLDTARPELSGLVFSLYDKDGTPQDGFLRLNQIYNLKLNSDLVVLSACQTALGKDVRGEGLIGLTRGFMYAGAKRVIASLWKVDDAATSEFMKRFYQNLLQKKLAPNTALRQTQNEMRQLPRFRSPYFWAGFTLHGDWK